MHQNQGSFIKDCLRASRVILPSLVPIFLGDILLIFVFLNLGKEKLSFDFFAFAVLEAITLFFIGKLSDKWSRKKSLILMHFLTIPLLIFLYFLIDKTNQDSLNKFLYILIGAGMIFSPGPPCRAILIDNCKSIIIKFPIDNFYTRLHLTETRLIGISWIVQYLPWVLIPILALIPKSLYLFVLIIFLLFSIPFLIFFLIDVMEEKNSSHHEINLKKFKIPKFTLLGLLLAQTVFWATFYKIDFLVDNQFLFCMVGIGAVLGTSFGLFHKKTPHLSAITYCYTFGILLSLISFIYYIYFSNTTNKIDLQLILISTIGGFYLPFVYDIIINKGGFEHRSTMFALAEVMQGLASVSGMVLMTCAGDNPVLLFAATTILFMGAFYMQSKEKMR